MRGMSRGRMGGERTPGMVGRGHFVFGHGANDNMIYMDYDTEAYGCEDVFSANFVSAMLYWATNLLVLFDFGLLFLSFFETGQSKVAS